MPAVKKRSGGIDNNDKRPCNGALVLYSEVHHAILDPQCVFELWCKERQFQKHFNSFDPSLDSLVETHPTMFALFCDPSIYSSIDERMRNPGSINSIIVPTALCWNELNDDQRSTSYLRYQLLPCALNPPMISGNQISCNDCRNSKNVLVKKSERRKDAAEGAVTNIAKLRTNEAEIARLTEELESIRAKLKLTTIQKESEQRQVRRLRTKTEEMESEYEELLKVAYKKKSKVEVNAEMVQHMEIAVKQQMNDMRSYLAESGLTEAEIEAQVLLFEYERKLFSRGLNKKNNASGMKSTGDGKSWMSKDILHHFLSLSHSMPSASYEELRRYHPAMLSRSEINKLSAEFTPKHGIQHALLDQFVLGLEAAIDPTSGKRLNPGVNNFAHPPHRVMVTYDEMTAIEGYKQEKGKITGGATTVKSAIHAALDKQKREFEAANGDQRTWQKEALIKQCLEEDRMNGLFCMHVVTFTGMLASCVIYQTLSKSMTSVLLCQIMEEVFHELGTCNIVAVILPSDGAACNVSFGKLYSNLGGTKDWAHTHFYPENFPMKPVFPSRDVVHVFKNQCYFWEDASGHHIMLKLLDGMYYSVGFAVISKAIEVLQRSGQCMKPFAMFTKDLFEKNSNDRMTVWKCVAAFHESLELIPEALVKIRDEEMVSSGRPTFRYRMIEEFEGVLLMARHLRKFWRISTTKIGQHLSFPRTQELLQYLEHEFVPFLLTGRKDALAYFAQHHLTDDRCVKKQKDSDEMVRSTDENIFWFSQKTHHNMVQYAMTLVQFIKLHGTDMKPDGSPDLLYINRINQDLAEHGFASIKLEQRHGQLDAKGTLEGSKKVMLKHLIRGIVGFRRNQLRIDRAKKRNSIAAAELCEAQPTVGVDGGIEADPDHILLELESVFLRELALENDPKVLGELVPEDDDNDDEEEEEDIEKETKDDDMVIEPNDGDVAVPPTNDAPMELEIGVDGGMVPRTRHDWLLILIKDPLRCRKEFRTFTENENRSYIVNHFGNDIADYIYS